MPNWNEVRDAVAEDFEEGGRLDKINVADIREGDTVTVWCNGAPNNVIHGKVRNESGTLVTGPNSCGISYHRILSHIPAAWLDSVRDGGRLNEPTYQPTLRERAWRSESNAWRVRFETAQRELAEEKAGRLTWQERAEEMERQRDTAWASIDQKDQIIRELQRERDAIKVTLRTALSVHCPGCLRFPAGSGS